MISPACLRSLLLVLSVWLIPATSAWAQVHSIQEFVGLKDRWDNYVGTRWRLEGRFSVLGDRDMRFENCDLDFRLPVEFVRTRWDSKVIEVSGVLDKQNGRFLFILESVNPVLDDMANLARRRTALNMTDSSGWTSLAEWARGRGTFYRDQKLLDAARDLEQQGLKVEFANTAAGNEKALAALAEKARAKQADELFLKEIHHEQLWARLRLIRSEPFQDVIYRDLALRVGLEFPAALQALPSYPVELAETYRINPRSSFQTADAARRQVLARLLYLEVMSSRIMAEFREDGSNGFEIAARLKADAPERTDLIQKAQNLAVSSRRDKVTVMSRTAVTEFATQLKAIGRTQDAEAVQREWLASQENRLSADDARGRGELADSWMLMTGDQSQAFRLYADAWKVNHDYTPATQWLTANNYKLLGQVWLPAAEVPAIPRSEMDAAVESGRVLKGMTPTQVRLALGTAPDSVTRLASSRRIIELWIYSSGYVVHFERQFHQQEGRVESIEELRH